ncbi:MAG: glycosyltransferase, partial [Acidobacteria bacterium]|nr:glycosyltransferase [Acidobacteriota bacterium]
NVRSPDAFYKGVRLVLLPTISHKYFDTVAHTFLSVWHVLFQRVDVVLICNAANSIFSWIPRLAGQKTVINVDGLERKRRKWNAFGKAYYRLSERLSTLLPHALVTDARSIQKYYRERYGKDSYFIPYGAEDQRVSSTACLERLGLEPDGYFLYVSRLEPENNALLVVRAFERVATDKKLVIVGDAPYARSYIAQVQATSDPRISFPGAIYGEGYRELQSHAFCYIHATEVGGTHPALIEAMGCGRCVLYLDTVENREVAGSAAIAFEKSAESLAEKMTLVLNTPSLRQQCETQGLLRVRQCYRWEEITTQYERLFQRLIGQKRLEEIESPPAHPPEAVESEPVGRARPSA